MTVQDRILELLAKAGWAKYKLAKKTGLYPTTVYDWFNEKYLTPSRESVESVCEAMGVTLAEFYSGIDESALDREQLLLLELFARVPESKHKVVFDLLRSLAK